MEVVFGFVIFLAGMFFGGLAVIVVFAKAGLNKQNVEWLQQIEYANKRKLRDADVERIKNRIAEEMMQAMEQEYRTRRHHA